MVNLISTCIVSTQKKEEEEDGGGKEGGEEEEVSLGVIMTNTEIMFHILLFKFCFSVSFI
jgi:hypothetical protein